MLLVWQCHQREGDKLTGGMQSHCEVQRDCMLCDQSYAARPLCSSMPGNPESESPGATEPGLHALCKESSDGWNPLLLVQACCSFSEHEAVTYRCMRCWCTWVHWPVCSTWSMSSGMVCCWVHKPLDGLTEDSQVNVLRGEVCSSTCYMTPVC
jgi:hypothetical protein